MTSVAWAQELARQHLADVLPRRWVHVRAVAARASSVGEVMPDERELVIVAAWLHDLGYG